MLFSMQLPDGCDYVVLHAALAGPSEIEVGPGGGFLKQTERGQLVLVSLDRFQAPSGEAQHRLGRDAVSLAKALSGAGVRLLKVRSGATVIDNLPFALGKTKEALQGQEVFLGNSNYCARLGVMAGQISHYISEIFGQIGSNKILDDYKRNPLP